ncbi:MAG: radical SAM protein [Bacteroidaceae bacterium]|jgi:wyosine [tRNA(Phe)-imidazoG37] synthetase (radical SAM superfamily)|nr:radical SAM protein [Bacteroidaceae bacterium]
MPTIIYPSPIFGPVKSRRLGISLGINLLPADGKVCTFDCIYCECGLNATRRAKSAMPTREEVAKALEKKLIDMMRSGELPDVLTFAGNGEPTIHPRFGEIIDDTIKLRDRLCPDAKVSVLTNATLITRDSVFEALKKVDNNILKLDTVDTDYIATVDRPTGKYDIEAIIERMRAFEGRAVVQTMFLKGVVDGKDVDNTSDRYVMPWIDVVKKISPREVMIYTIDRETPVEGLQKATRDELDRIVELLAKENIKATASY